MAWCSSAPKRAAFSDPARAPGSGACRSQRRSATPFARELPLPRDAATGSWWRRPWRAPDHAAAGAGLRRLRWHDLRHSYASQLAIAGVPLRQLEAWLGHASIIQTERDAHHVADAQQHTARGIVPALGSPASRDPVAIRAAGQGPTLAWRRAASNVRSSAVSGSPYQVLVSHGGGDEFVACHMAKDIEACGVRAFIDQRDIPHGADFPLRIRDAMRASRELLVLFTPETLDRPWVWIELGLAFEREMWIVAVLYRVTAEAVARRGQERGESLLTSKNLLSIDAWETYLGELRVRSESR